MTKPITKIGSLLIACLLMVVLLCGPVASAEGLLVAMMDIALRADRTIEGTISIDAGELLSGFSMGVDEAEAMTLAVVNDLLTNGLLRVRYTQTGEEYVVGMALELREQTMVSLDVRTMGDEIALETSLLPGKTLVMPAEVITQSVTSQMSGVLDDALLEALGGAVERYTTIVATWAMETEGIVTMSEEPIPAAQTRDAAASAMTLRVTDAQGQALLRSLLAEFVVDDVLQQALAPQLGMEPEMLAMFAQQMASTEGTSQGGAVEVTIFFGDAEQIIGLDVEIEPPTDLLAEASTPLAGTFAYGHRTIDDEHAGDSYDASFTWGDGAELKAQFSRRDKIPNQILPGEGEEYGGRALLRTPETGALSLEVLGDIRRVVEPIFEAYQHTFDVQISQVVEGMATDATALAQMMQAPLLSGGFILENQTEVIGMEDFLSQGSFTLNLIGLEAAIHYTLESTTYTPEEHPENTVVRLDALTPEEMDALTQEMEQNALILLGSMLSVSE